MLTVMSINCCHCSEKLFVVLLQDLRILCFKMSPPMERIQILEAIEKDIITCLQSAGKIF